MSKKYSVLVVDDSAAMRGVLGACLQGSEFECIAEAKDGEEGVQQFNSCKPDIVLLDVVMPGLSGVETLAKIMEQNADAVVIMASSIGTEDTIESALKLGAKNFIQKPFEQENVLDVLRSTMA